MTVKFQIHSSSIQATLANDFLNIAEHVWECYYKDCMGLLHIIANFSTNIQPHQINICHFKVIQKNNKLNIKGKGLTF